MAGYDLYKYCREVISAADPDVIRTFFLREIKKRKNNTALLRRYPMPIRQIMLSLNLTEQKAEKLMLQLSANIKRL